MLSLVGFATVTLAGWSHGTPPPPPSGPSAELDAMWLRQPVVANPAKLAAYKRQLKSVAVHADAASLADEAALAQLHTVAEELGQGLTNLLGTTIPATCCDDATTAGGAGMLVVDVGPTHAAATGMEGFGITSGSGNVTTLRAATASGALYGAFRLLSYVQRGAALPVQLIDRPRMELRIWDLWDDLSGDVTRGFAGDSLIWPQAMWRDPNTNDGPAPTELFLAPCDAADPLQHWAGGALSHPGAVSGIKSGSGGCVTMDGTRRVVPCRTIAPGDDSSKFWFNTTALQISVGPLVRHFPAQFPPF